MEVTIQTVAVAAADFVELSAAIISLQSQLSSEREDSLDEKRVQSSNNIEGNDNNTINLLNPLNLLDQD
eukprot:6696510-Ditylum_brightwellii.AAC.1